MDLPKVSIIIPVYNVDPYIAECLQSVMQQNYEGPLECIVVDDCGTDRSMEVAEKLIAEYDGPIEFRLLHHEKNMGLSCARNTGINAATGEYIFFLDSDDIITDDCIDTLTSQLKKGNFDIIVGNHDVFGNRTLGGKEIPEEGLIVSGEEFSMLYFFEKKVTVAVWNKLFSHEYLKAYNMLFEPGLVREDNIHAFRYSCVPTRMYLIKKITLHYRYLREGSTVLNLISNPLADRDCLVQMWNKIRSYCETDKYNEVHEITLHVYGKRIFVNSRVNGLEYKSVFCSLNKNYPYHPVLIWLSGKQNFRWLLTRLIWVFPSLFAYYYYKLKEGIKARLYA